jgi:hypothetical protein
VLFPPVAGSVLVPLLPPFPGGTTLTGWVGPQWGKSAPASTHTAIEAIVLAFADFFIGASIPETKLCDARSDPRPSY